MGKVINMIELLDNYFSAHHSVSISHFSYALCVQQWACGIKNLFRLNSSSAHACIPFPLARLILSTHSLNALTCSEESSVSSIVARSALRERSISFLVNRKQITLTQRGENLLRPIALVIRNFMPCLSTTSVEVFILAYNTHWIGLLLLFYLQADNRHCAWDQPAFSEHQIWLSGLTPPR